MGMTREEQNRKLKAFITCLKCEVNGKSCDDNCPTQYEAGTMGEIIENLEAISKALEQEPTTKNDLGVSSGLEKNSQKLEKNFGELDCISREQAKQFLYERIDRLNDDELYDIFSKIIDDMYNELPSVTPQEPIFDKIRAEIAEVYNANFEDVDFCDGLERALIIIDKYKAQSEDKE